MMIDSPTNKTEPSQWQHTKKGKGKVAPRTRAAPGASMIPIPKLTAVSHR